MIRLFIVFNLFLGFFLNGQNSELVYTGNNVSTLMPARTYASAEGYKYNKPEYRQHPDFGLLTFDAPYGKNVAEDISKRKPDERFYIDLNDPHFFYIQKSGRPINYYKDGLLLAIDPTLRQTAPGQFRALRQPRTTEINTLLSKTILNCGTNSIAHNRYTLTVLKNDQTVNEYNSNWTNYTIGNNGAYISNIFPGIDMKIIVDEGQIKSNFLINSPILNVKSMIFTDHLELSSGLSLVQQSGFSGQLFKDEINVIDQNNITQFLIRKAMSYDASGNEGKTIFNNYKIIGNKLELHVDSAFLNKSGIVYPLTIDPLFTAVGPIAAPANTIGSNIFPLFCSQSMTLTYPGGSTPWDFSSGWVIEAGLCCSIAGSCRRSWSLVDILSNCGGKTPSGAGFYWQCAVGTCSLPGIWNPTIPFNSSGTQSMIQCLTPSCSNQTVAFTFNLARSSGACPLTGGCNCTWATNTCLRLNSWNVTLQGRSLETLSETITGNGTTTIAAVCNSTVTLNPTPQYGVSPFTYLWSPGLQTTPTITYSPVSPGTVTFNCLVTDACGTTRTASFAVTNNCVLPIELSSFDLNYTGSVCEVNWSTASEKNSDYFLIEKSVNGGSFQFLEKTRAAGNSTEKLNYKVLDEFPEKNGTSIYRLRLFDKDKSKESYETFKILNTNADLLERITVRPNPARNEIEIQLTKELSRSEVNVFVYDNLGRNALSLKANQNQKGSPIKLNIEVLDKGIYTLYVIGNNGQRDQVKFIKE